MKQTESRTAGPKVEDRHPAEEVPSDRRVLVESALTLQRKDGGTAGATHLFGPTGLHPQYWGVSKKQLQDVREHVREGIRLI